MVLGQGKPAVSRLTGAARAALASSTDEATLEEAANEFRRLSNDMTRQLDRLRALKWPLPAIRSCDGKETLSFQIGNANAPWNGLPIPPNNIPGMIMDGEIRYYVYIGKFFSGRGQAVELGPWLGRSTKYIADSLAANPKFAGRKLHVFDDFVWRTSWMNRHLPTDMHLPNHASFQHYYDRYTADFAQHLKTTRCKITDHDGNESLPPLAWNDGPIEMLYVDCGRTLDANNAWYHTLRPFFIPDVTLIIMQDWGLHREIPAKWFNQTRQFTDSKEQQLQLVHDITDGNIGAFIYRG